MLLDDKLERGELIILDGATGSEIKNFGGEVDSVTWCGAANIEHPDSVRRVHEAYIAAGADIITTNTFATCRHVLDGAGLGPETKAINRKAVELAKAARDNANADRSIAIAGSLSNMNAWVPGTITADPNYLPTRAQAEANYGEVAETLAEAGVDLIILEMMSDLELAPLAVRAAQSTGLPIWIGLSCSLDKKGDVIPWDARIEHPREVDAESPRRRSPVAMATLIEHMLPFAPQVMGVMHSTIETTHPAVALLKNHWKGPLMAYPETIGTTDDGHRDGVSDSPDVFARNCQVLTKSGVQIIGGCCGTTVGHLREMVKTLH